MGIFVDSLYDAVVDCLKVLPILFLAYLLVSFLSHDHSHKFSRFLSKNRASSVFYASVLGCVPQCGFSSVVADLYAERHVSIGTLIAVLVATSDEAIPIMLSNKNSIVPMLELIAIKLVLAVVWGYAIDLAVRAFLKKKRKAGMIEHAETHHEHEEHAHHEHEHHKCGHIHCEHCENNCGHSHGDCCGNNIMTDAFDHTLGILIYIFVATFVIDLIVGYAGTKSLENLLTDNVYVQVVVAALIGLIPNCVSSVLLVELFVGVEVAGQIVQVLSFPALVAGLTAGAGVGLIILFTRNRKRPLENLGIIFLQYLIGVASGMFLTIFF